MSGAAQLCAVSCRQRALEDWAPSPKRILRAAIAKSGKCYTDSEPKAIFEHLSVSVEQAEAICEILSGETD